ncbi:hypothetical protein AVEN_59166-1 [Araneus ventricosus]|uniref:Uncharacterized protein n=1 Tax=Araneus ventricosus TaxID=182803 RepID=A0A4Y2IPS9_ARAVE|nr:hypothetical protein AVEN_59166-1 [Araneus ventricosus]
MTERTGIVVSYKMVINGPAPIPSGRKIRLIVENVINTTIPPLWYLPEHRESAYLSRGLFFPIYKEPPYFPEWNTEEVTVMQPQIITSPYLSFQGNLNATSRGVDTGIDS